MAIYVDHTHLGRHVTGLERITLELFSPAALAPLDVVPVTARGTGQMVATQTLGLPMRLAASSSILLCPGFPPSPLLRPFASRVLPYIHDDFLLTRAADLNRRARLYMAKPFKLALRHYPRFLAKSRDTKRKLATHCRPDAEITLYRPPVRNVFNLQSGERAQRASQASPLRVVALGTVEPRKNFVAAGNIVRALHAQGFPGATLDVLGRKGWGEDWQILEKMSGVTLHGYQPPESVSRILD
ncbi:MAG: glycosyl transferase, partial [Tardiphaga sp.]|nr:glycosyl transferase [Tardiphaga sp.]